MQWIFSNLVKLFDKIFDIIWTQSNKMVENMLNAFSLSCSWLSTDNYTLVITGIS